MHFWSIQKISQKKGADEQHLCPPREVCTSTWSCLTEAFATQNLKIWRWFPMPLLMEFGFELVAKCGSVLHPCMFGQNRLEGCTSVKHYWNVSLPMDFSAACSHKQPVAQVTLPVARSKTKDLSKYCGYVSFHLCSFLFSSANTLPSSDYFHLNHLVNQIWQRQGGLINSLCF